MISRALRELSRCFPFICKGLVLVWQAAKQWSVFWITLLVVQGLIPAALIQLLRITVDRLTPAFSVKNPSDTFAAALVPIVLIGLLWLLGQLTASLMKWVRTAQAELVQDHIHSLIHKQSLALDVAFYENPESYDLLHRAKVDAVSQPLALLESIGSLFQNGITLGVLAFMLAVYTPLLPLLLILSAVPGLWFVGHHVIREHQWRLNNTSNERRSRYYDWILTDRNAAAEMRLFSLGDHHQSAFRNVKAHLRSGRLALARGEMKAELAAGIVAFFGGAVGMAIMLFRAASGLARLGDLVLCYQSFQQGQKLLRTILESAGRIYRSTLFLENLFSFLEIKPEINNPVAPRPVPGRLDKGICFNNISFRYPGSERIALRAFSVSFPANGLTAIVGHNGAGKSTLIKLLCRFYDPQEGSVLLDGVDLREFDPGEVRNKITVLFQEPVRYHTSAAENIAMGDFSSHPEMAQITAVAEAAGAHFFVERLPQGYETVLGKWFGGAELSVGEWQRIALARAFLRNAPIIALDEPTSAMDSWAESDWLAKFRQLTKGHTALMITHRFTTAMHADMIHVMQDGRIIESGTHEQLVALGGGYAHSWAQQMREVANG